MMKSSFSAIVISLFFVLPALSQTSKSLLSFGIPATITIPEGLTAEISKSGIDVLIKLSDGGTIDISNTYEKKDIAIFIKEFKESVKTIFESVVYLVDEPDVLLYNAKQLNSDRFSLNGYKKINGYVYNFGQEIAPGINFTEAQCRSMLAVFRSLKADKP
jgi:predicted TIM-barrel enzyme